MLCVYFLSTIQPMELSEVVKGKGSLKCLFCCLCAWVFWVVIRLPFLSHCMMQVLYFILNVPLISPSIPVLGVSFGTDFPCKAT